MFSFCEHLPGPLRCQLVSACSLVHSSSSSQALSLTSWLALLCSLPLPLILQVFTVHYSCSPSLQLPPRSGWVSLCEALSFSPFSSTAVHLSGPCRFSCCPAHSVSWLPSHDAVGYVGGESIHRFPTHFIPIPHSTSLLVSLSLDGGVGKMCVCWVCLCRSLCVSIRLFSLCYKNCGKKYI